MKKAGSLALRIISVAILIFAVFVMIFTIITVNTVGKEADIFGYRPYVVLSDSMHDEFAAGDLIVSREVDPASLKAGDVITFRSIDPAGYGGVTTHKIREITTYEGGLAFVTYGTATGADDAYPAPAENVMGQYVFRLPKMGYFFQFLRSVPGYFLLIFTPFVILIVLQTVKFFKLLGQYRQEQREETLRHSQELESERERVRAMEEELRRLRAKAGESDAAFSGENAPESAPPPEQSCENRARTIDKKRMP